MSLAKDVEATSGVPVTPTGIPVRNLWYMLLYAWRELRTTTQWKVEVETSPTLDALLAEILSKLVEQRLRIGLGRGYIDDESTIRGIRGRIDFPKSLRQLAFQHGRAHCRFQTFSPNMPANQIICSTLARLAQIGNFGPACSKAIALRQRLRRLVLDLDSVDLIELKPDFVRRQQLLRHDADYRLMLAICNLLIQREMPTETAGVEDLAGLDRDGMTLWRVFEEFVARFYEAHLAGWDVSPQAKLHWPTVEPSDYVPEMRPDLVLRHILSGRIIVLDTKFTAKSLIAGQHEKLRFSRDHLFQIYAYLRTQDHKSDEHRSAIGMLLYPTASHKLSEQIEVQGHQIRWETIDLALPWEEIETSLLQMIPDEVEAETDSS